MVSALCDRKDGVGIWLTQQQLGEINERRTGENSIWKEYISKSSAMEIYGTTKKKNLPIDTRTSNTFILVQTMRDIGTMTEWPSRWRMYLMFCL